jgi:hypothetical protein
MLAEHGGNEGGTVELHKWLGIASAVAACVAAACAVKAKSDGGALMLLRVATMLGATLVMAAGYLGGEMTMARATSSSPSRRCSASRTRRRGREEAARRSEAPTVDVKQPESKEPLQTPAKISFEKEIAPIIKDMCFKCHGGEKVKGKFKLNNKTFAMDGGESGKAINPGKPEISKFYTSLVDGDEDIVMPPPKEKARRRRTRSRRSSSGSCRAPTGPTATSSRSETRRPNPVDRIREESSPLPSPVGEASPRVGLVAAGRDPLPVCGLRDRSTAGRSAGSGTSPRG